MRRRAIDAAEREDDVLPLLVGVRVVRRVHEDQEEGDEDGETGAGRGHEEAQRVEGHVADEQLLGAADCASMLAGWPRGSLGGGDAALEMETYSACPPG